MSASYCLENLFAYSVQVALVVLVGELAAAVLHLRQPRVMLAYWQALLAACLLLPLFEPWRPALYAPAGDGATSIGTQTGGVGSLVSVIPVHNWLLLVVGVGAGLGLLRLAVGILRLRHYRRAGIRIGPLPSALRDAQALVGVEAAFYFSDRVGSPVTFGWLDPAVIFPRRFERMDEGHQRAIACHELLHVARRDWLMNLLEELILTLFWFHPAIWWVVRSLRLSREQVVDSEVVALSGARKPYLHALLEIAAAPRAITLPAPLFLVENQLARRVASLVKEVRMSKPRLIASLVIALAVVAATGWWGVRTFWLTAPRHGIVYTVGGDVTAPIPIYRPEPAYTPEARAAKLEGTDVFWVVIDDRGTVEDVRLVRSVGKGLDESAIGTLRTWKFQPARRKGIPVPVRLIVEVSFRIY